MANRIKGITIEIDGDTTKFQKSIREADKELKQTQTSLRDVNKLLKLDPKNTDLLKQKQELLAKSVETTSTRLNELKKARDNAEKNLGNYDAWKSENDQIKEKIDKTSESLKKMKSEKEALVKAGKIDTEEYKKLDNKIKESEEELKQLKQSQKDCADEFGHPISKEQYNSLQREIVETEQNLKDLENETKKFGSVGAQQIKAVGESMKDIGGKMTSVGQDMTMKVTAPIAAGAGIAVAKFAEVDKTMALTNKTMGNSKDQADILNKAMKDAAANSTFGMNDAANASLNFARAGLDAEQAAASLAPAMNLAAGEGGNLDTVSAGLVGTINGFGDSFDNASQYADVFANACNNSALDVDSLSGAMSVAAPIFKTAGYSVNDAALYMGVLANNGIDANTGANALKTGLARLVSPAAEGAKAMKQLGIEVTNSDGTMKSTIEIQQQLHDKFSQLSESEQMAAASSIFGKNQMSAWLALINTAPQDVQKLNDQIGQTGTTSEMSNAMMSGFGGSIEKLKSSVDVFATTMGETLAPIISAVAEKVQAFVDWLNSLSEGQRQAVVVIGLVVAAIGPLLMIIGSVISAIGTIMTVLPLLAGPIGGVIIAITAVIAIIVAVMTHLEQIKAAGKSVADFFAKLWQEITSTLTAAWNRIVEFFSQAWEKITGHAKQQWNVLKQFFSDLWNGIKNIFSSVVNGIASFLSSAWNGMKSVASTVWNAIKDHIVQPIQNAWNTLKSVLGNIKSGISSAFNAVKSTISSVFGTLFDIITSPFRKAWDTISGVINKLKNAFSFKWELPKLKLPHISVSGGKAPFGIAGRGSLPKFDIKWYAKAMNQPYTFNSPTVIGVGEKGSETVVGTEWLKEHTGNTTINMTVNGAPGQDVRKLADLVADRITAKTQQKVRAFS